METEIGVLESLRSGQPGLDLGLLLGLEGDEQEIDLSVEVGGKTQLFLGEVVCGQGREGRGFLVGSRLSSVARGQQKSAKRKIS